MAVQMDEMKIGGRIVYRIAAGGAEALLTPYGAHVLSFRLADGRGGDVLWGLGRRSGGSSETMLRGGIPVCWPWFGKAGTPIHGFARSSEWNMTEPEEEADGSATVVFTLGSGEYGLSATLSVNIGHA